MTGRQAAAVIKENGSLIQIVSAMVVVIAVLADKVGGSGAGEANDIKLQSIKDTVGEIKTDLRSMSAKIDPLGNRLTALEIRVGAVETAIGKMENGGTP